MINKTNLFLIGAIAALVWFLGFNKSDNQYQNELKAYQDSLKIYESSLAQRDADSARLIQANPDGDIAFSTNQIENALGNPYLSASQGIEVHLEGLEWRGKYFDPALIQDIKTKFSGRYVNTINQIHLDPDFPRNGYPDLFIDIQNAPTIYQPGAISSFLKDILNVKKPVNSYWLNTNSGKAKMDLWLVEFDMTFRIEPSDNHSRNREIVFDGIHPITRESDNSIRGKREMKNQRYDQMNVLLKIQPNVNHWYIADKNENGVYEPNGSPKIGVAAIECLQIQKVGEEGINNQDTRIGIVLNKGKSLPLYPSAESLKSALTGTPFTPEVAELTKDYLELTNEEGKPIRLNNQLFNQAKYSYVSIQNLGSWKEEKSWPLGPTTFNADYFHASFLVHLYVLGEWTVKPSSFVAFEARKPFKVTKPGLLDQLLPDFKLGIFGKFVITAVLIIGLTCVLAIFFPPLFKLINALLKRVTKSVQSEE